MAIKRYVKRAAKRAGRVVKKRYFKGKGYGRPNLSTMVRDIALVKRSLNVEKKNIQSAIAVNNNIGQCNVNADTGQQFYDITPAIVQGTGYNQMCGNSVKLVSMAFRGQLKQQSGTAHPMKVRMIIFTKIGTPATAASIQAGNQLLDINPLSTVTDYNSERNINYFRDFKILKSQSLYLAPDPTTGEIMIKDIKVIMKLNHHLKWNNNTTTLTSGQLLVAFFSDSGNVSTTTASTLPNIPILKINSGATLQFYTKFYYVDN